MYRHLPDGTVIEEKAHEIVKEISERFPNVKVQFLNPETIGDLTAAPYRIVEKGRDGFWREILPVWNLDRRVIDDLYAMQFFGAKELARRVEALEAEESKRRQDEFRDNLDEANDMAEHALRANRSSYTIRTEAGVKKLDMWYGGQR